MILSSKILLIGGLAVMGLVFLVFAFTVTKTLSRTLAEKREIDKKAKLKPDGKKTDEKKNDEEN